MALQFVAEGAAGGLNVITVYVAEILRATGVGGEWLHLFIKINTYG